MDEGDYTFICNFRCGYDEHGFIAIQFSDTIGERTFPVMLLGPDMAESAAMALLQVCKNMSGESVQ